MKPIILNIIVSLGLIGGVMAIADSEIKTGNLLKASEITDAAWTINNGQLIGGGYAGGKCVSFKIRQNENAQPGGFAYGVATKTTLAVTTNQPYAISVWAVGTGELWLHAWCYDPDNKYVGDLKTPANGVHFAVDTVSWQQFGMAPVNFPARTATVKLCIEVPPQTKRNTDLRLDRAEFKPLSATSTVPVPEARIKIDKTMVRQGEWLNAVAVELKAAPGRRITGYTWGYLRSDDTVYPYGWPENADGKQFRSQPLFAGKYDLGLTVQDNFGLKSKPFRVKVDVLPNRPPEAHITYSWLDNGKVKLTAAGTHDPDGDKLSDYRWELPDGMVRRGAEIEFDPGKLAAFAVHLTVKDQWGLEGQAEVDVVRMQTASPDATTVAMNLLLTINADGTLAAVPTTAVTLPVRLGYGEVVPVTLHNAASTPVTVELARGVTEGGDNTWIRPVRVTVAAGQTVQTAIRLKTILNIGHQAELLVTTAVGTAKLPLRLQVRESYPLFGTQEHFYRNPPGRETGLKDMAYLAELPSQLYRLPDVLTWGITEKKGDQLIYHLENADWEVKNLREIGKTQLHPFLGYVPEWLKPLDVDFTGKEKYWKAYVQTVVKRYKGQVRYWEAFNEPPWHGVQDWDKNGEPVMFALMKDLAEIVRAEDPAAKVVAPGFTDGTDLGHIIEPIIKKGGDQYVDVYNFHDYQSWEWMAVMRLTPEFDRKVEAGPAMAHVALLKKYQIAKPLFISECGGNIAPTSVELQRLKAMQWLRTNFIWLAAGIKGIEQYEFMDYPHEGLPSLFNLMRHSDHFKLPMFTATREIIKTMTGTLPDGKGVITLKEANIRYAVFNREHEQTIALWSCENFPVTVELTFPARAVREMEEKIFNYRGEEFFSMKRWVPEAANDRYRLRLMPYQARLITIDKAVLTPLPLMVRFVSGKKIVAVKTVKNAQSTAFEMTVTNQTAAPLAITASCAGEDVPQTVAPGAAIIKNYSLDREQLVTVRYRDRESEAEINEEYAVKPDIFCPYVTASLAGKAPSADSARPLMLKDENGKAVGAAYVSWNRDFFYFTLIAEKGEINQPYGGSEIFRGDSIQLAFDVGPEPAFNYGVNSTELGLAWIPAVKKSLAFCWYSGPTGKTGERTELDASVKIEAGRTVYRLALPWQYIGVKSPSAGDRFAFNFLLNDYDGVNRRLYEYTPGIGSGKLPCCYYQVVLAKS